MELTGRQIAEYLGISKQAVLQRAKREKWPHIEAKGNGGNEKRFQVKDLPAAIQTVIVKRGDLRPEACAGLCPEAALEAARRFSGGMELELSINRKATWSGVDASIVKDERVARIARILSEADQVPRGWKKRAWVEAVALKHDVRYQTIYKWKKKYGQGGLGALQHTKTTRGQASAWDDEALEFWIGLCLKREHRHKRYTRNELYHNILVVEAHRRGWKIGSLRSAYEWAEKRLTKPLLALQRGGARALDNQLPPVLRNYSDLAPFQLLVGDQHRWDFWVVDDDTGEVIRPEGYYFQDLRTRLIYGGVSDRKYDSRLIGPGSSNGHGSLGTLLVNLYRQWQA